MNTRTDWIDTLERVALPLFTALAHQRLKAEMPVECPTNPQGTPHTYLEALGRSLAGIAPWLEQEPMDKEEREKRDRMVTLVLASIDHGTSPDSPDFRFNRSSDKTGVAGCGWIWQNREMESPSSFAQNE